MSSQDFLQNVFRGSLGGTLNGLEVTTPGAQPSEFGMEAGPFMVPSPSLPGVGAPAAPPPGALPGTPGPGALHFQRQAAPVNTDLASEIRRARERTEDESGGAMGTFLDFVGTPIDMFFDIVGNLDRPQQFVWAATMRALEDANLQPNDLGEILAAGARGFMRDDDPYSQNSRVEPQQLINAFGKKFFNMDNLDEQIDPLNRFVLHGALLIGFDPLVFIPGATYVKAGGRLKNMYNMAQAARKTNQVLTHGVDIRGAASIMSNEDIFTFLKQFGKKEGEADMILRRVAEDLTDDELEKLRPVIGDYLTGMGIRGAVVDRINAITRAGREVSKEELTTLLADMGRLPMSTSDTENMAEVVSRLVGRLRGEPKHEIQYLREVTVGNQRTKQMVKLTAQDDNFVVGQLVNRFGLDPLDAVNPTVIKAAREIALESGRAKKVLADAAEKATTQDLGGMWNALSQRERMSILDEGRHLSKQGRKVRDTRSELSRRMVGETFDPAKDSRQIIGQLSQAERSRLVGKLVEKTPLSRRSELQKKLSPDEFFDELFKRAGIEVPENANDAFKAAQRRAYINGPHVVDPVVADALRARWMKAGVTLDGALELGEVAAGLRHYENASDIPEIMGRGDIMNSMLDSGQWDTKNWHIFTGLLDPKQVLPGPAFGMLKLAEDVMISESNFLARKMEDFMTVGGKKIKEGSELSSLLGRALDGNAGALLKIKNWDEKGEALGAYHHLRAFYDGMAVRFGRAGFKGFEEGAPVAQDYFPRLYKNLDEQVNLDELVEMGVLDTQEAKNLASSLARNPEGWHAAISPMEMDFVKGTDAHFRHLLPRKYRKGKLKQDYDAIRMTRAYNHGALRKLHLESAIKQVNQAMKDRKGKFTEEQKRYASMLFKRMLGVPSSFETSLNRTLESIAGSVGIKLNPRPATRASLFITRRFYSGLLGGNIGFMLKNLSQGINTATELGPLNVMRGVAKLSDPEFRELRHSQNLVNDFTQLFERGKFGGHGLLRRIDDWLMKATGESVEAVNRGVAFNAGLTDFLRQKGVNKKSIKWLRENKPELLEEGVNFAHSVANETQFIYGVMGRSPIAGDPIGRMALQFMSWPVKQMEFLSNGTFRNPEGPWAGAQFMMRYLMMSGWLSKIAEHANVDAQDFTGFGFFPGFASPTTQVFFDMIQGIESAAIEGNTEESREHFRDMVRNLENMIPAWNQLMKTQGAVESIVTGESRGYRERLYRFTDQEEYPAARSALDAVTSTLRMPELSTEQAVKLVGLQPVSARREREMQKEMLKVEQEMARKTQRYVDAYIEASYGGAPDWQKAYEIISEARAEGINIDASKINAELQKKVTPSTLRLYEGMSIEARQRAISEVTGGEPRILGIPILPPNSLMNTGNKEGVRP